MAVYAGYGSNIVLHGADKLVVHRSQDPRVVIIEYDVHGKTVATGSSYDNRFISIVTIEGRKSVQWRDYMDSLAAMTALDSGAVAIVWAPASCKGRHIRVRIYESPHGGRLLGWVSVRVAGKGSLWTASLHRIVRREPLVLFVKVAAKALPPDW